MFFVLAKEREGHLHCFLLLLLFFLLHKDDSRFRHPRVTVLKMSHRVLLFYHVSSLICHFICSSSVRYRQEKIIRFVVEHVSAFDYFIYLFILHESVMRSEPTGMNLKTLMETFAGEAPVLHMSA